MPRAVSSIRFIAVFSIILCAAIGWPANADDGTPTTPSTPPTPTPTTPTNTPTTPPPPSSPASPDPVFTKYEKSLSKFQKTLDTCNALKKSYDGQIEHREGTRSTLAAVTGIAGLGGGLISTAGGALTLAIQSGTGAKTDAATNLIANVSLGATIVGAVVAFAGGGASVVSETMYAPKIKTIRAEKDSLLGGITSATDTVNKTAGAVAGLRGSYDAAVASGDSTKISNAKQAVVASLPPAIVAIDAQSQTLALQCNASAQAQATEFELPPALLQRLQLVGTSAE